MRAAMPGRSETRERPRPLPRVSAILRREEPGRPLVDVAHAERHQEVGAREIVRAGKRTFGTAALFGRDTRHLRLRRRNQPCVALHLPRRSAIQAAREQVLLRTRAVDRMARRSARFHRVGLHVARREAHEDLVAPRPDAVVGRPAAVPARLAPHDDVGGVGGDGSRGRIGEGQGKRGADGQRRGRAHERRRLVQRVSSHIRVMCC